MNLQQRKELLVRLGNYMQGNDASWLLARQKAFAENNWFIPEFIDRAVSNIVLSFLTPKALEQLVEKYQLNTENPDPKKVGIVMAGNIPLVGFHDLLCVFISGHYAMIKPSSKDDALIRHLVEKMKEWEPGSGPYFTISEQLKNCEAYIATGSNNSSRYFEYYFQKYPSIIRKNRTSVAILTGKETEEELKKLADDVYLYFGLGCRNVTKIYVPKNYDFRALLAAFRKYDHLASHHKYKNNYDYNLAIQILNNRYYMSNGSLVLTENESLFSPISQLHYQYYQDEQALIQQLKDNKDIQCIVGSSTTGFGQGQCPGICDFADGVDTMDFLAGLSGKQVNSDANDLLRSS